MNALSFWLLIRDPHFFYFKANLSTSLKLYERVSSMKISLADVEAILESIKETKRLLKPLAATKDELLEGAQRNDRDLDDDRIELLNPAIVKQIGESALRNLRVKLFRKT